MTEWGKMQQPVSNCHKNESEDEYYKHYEGKLRTKAESSIKHTWLGHLFFFYIVKFKCIRELQCGDNESIDNTMESPRGKGTVCVQ